MAKKNRKEIKGSQNVLADTSIEAGRNVHVGNVVNHIYNNEKENLDDTGYLKEKRKIPFFNSIIFKLALVSVSLIGVSIAINIKECTILKLMSPPTEDEPGKKTLRDSVTAEEPEEKEKEKNEDLQKPAPASVSPPKTKPEKPKINLADFIDTGQSPQIALFNSDNTQLNNFRNEIINQLQKGEASFSNTYLRPQFELKFGQDIQSIDLASLRKIGLTKSLNCICQIEENIEIEPGETAGIKRYTARGNIKIHILNLKTGKREIIHISPIANGAGISESAALKSLEGRFLKSDKLNSINITQCK